MRADGLTQDKKVSQQQFMLFYFFWFNPLIFNIKYTSFAKDVHPANTTHFFS